MEGRRRRRILRKQYMDNIKKCTQLTTSQCVRAAERRSTLEGNRQPTITHVLPNRRRYISQGTHLLFYIIDDGGADVDEVWFSDAMLHVNVVGLQNLFRRQTLQ